MPFRHTPATTVAIIPVLNEAKSIGKVLDDIPRDWVDRVIVVDNGSTDNSPEIARAHGAEVYVEPERGYGAACLRGLAALPEETEYIVFLDGDYSDYPEECAALLTPLKNNEADMTLGSREQGTREKGALTPQARFGNWLATSLISLRWGHSFTDLGPFRAIRRDALDQLKMKDRNYGWTVEMQIKAVIESLRIQEIPVRYRIRIGQSKVSGTIKGVIGAGTKILWTIGRFAATLPSNPR
ncbi:MAG: glycosyltransferase family 2 protein [Myxococcales bacterium]|nr:glycosyltransferase family 2 protein [Myxococcales bacterium]MCB9644174.1 glycosyltransferase family 2 protein [Myxococcales bacterium]